MWIKHQIDIINLAIFSFCAVFLSLSCLYAIRRYRKVVDDSFCFSQCTCVFQTSISDYEAIKHLLGWIIEIMVIYVHVAFIFTYNKVRKK